MIKVCMDCKRIRTELGPGIQSTGLCEECLPARKAEAERMHAERQRERQDNQRPRR